jgi:hypothetical protein
MEVGDMSSGANPQTTQQTQNVSQNTNSVTGPNPFVQPFLQMGIQQLANNFAANPTAPGYYPGSTIAPASAATQAAQGALFARGASGSPFMPAATGLVNDTLNGKYLDPSQNPWLQAALQAGYNTQDQQFNNVQVPALRAQFEGSGRNLGGADMSNGQALLNLNQTQSNATAQAEEGAYNNERNIQQQTLGMLPSFQNMDYQNIAAMGQAGANTDAANQAAIDAAVARYNYGTTAQPNYISDFLARIGAGYPGGQTTSTGTSSGTSYGTITPASNPTASGIGAGLGALGTIAQFLPFIPGIGPSDVRLKKNVRGPIGRTNSGHNLYSYEFLGSDKPEIGVLAQEVERTDPDAVVTHPSGYKMVNYGRALAAPGGLM